MATDAPRPRVWFRPEDVGPRITLHAFWGADFGGETATFDTEQEAVMFCVRRWKRRPIIERPYACECGTHTVVSRGSVRRGSGSPSLPWPDDVRCWKCWGRATWTGTDA